MTDLAGAVAIVTGALGNLGPVWTSTLAGAGATVVGIDLAAQADDGNGVLLRRADVTDRPSLEAVRDEVLERYGPPSVLVNSAGIDQPPDAGARTWEIEDVPAADFRRTLEVNLTGAFTATQVFGAPMRDAGRGSIVNVGSLYASAAPEPAFYEHMDVDPPFLKPPAYGASKAGVLNLTRYFARLWGPHGVRVNALSPGGVAGSQDPEFLAKYNARVPLRRMADPDDLRGPLSFLASDDSRYVTGHELRVDGGFTA
ncbi:MAG: SDR family oxidoreductase [Solirubrobacteraceae bacterium]